MIARLLRLARTVRHVRFHQLWGRLSLTLRRRWRSRFAGFYRKRWAAAPMPALLTTAHLPEPVFPPRHRLASICGSEYRLTFLSETRSFSHPFDWRPESLQYGTRLWLLNLHYMEFLEGLPDASFVRVVDDWIENVPPYRNEYWMHDWNSYALSIRCVVWMQQYARRKTSLPDDFQGRLLASLMRQLMFLEDNLEKDIGGNHLIKNIKALLWAGHFWDNNAAKRWHTTGLHLLNRELDEQILPDGMHYERSPAYHTQVFADLLECYTLLNASPDKNRLHDRLTAMAQVLADTTHPDGMISLFNDGGLHMTYSPRTCLERWQRLSGVETTPRPTIALTAAGYYGLRSLDEYLLIDGGKVAPDFLTAHGHGDIFSFEWTIRQKRIVVDAGVFEYNAGPRRDYSRSTRAHNTLTLDGLDQCEFWGAFRMGRRARIREIEYGKSQDGFRLRGVHDGFSHLPGAPLHERVFNVRPGQIDIQDRVTGGHGQRNEARLLLHPACTIVEREKAVFITHEDVVVRIESDAVILHEDATWFPDFGIEYPCRQLVFLYPPAPGEGSIRLKRLR